MLRSRKCPRCGGKLAVVGKLITDKDGKTKVLITAQKRVNETVMKTFSEKRKG